MMDNTIGPNVRKLIARKAAFDAVPAGGNLGDFVDFINSGNFADSLKLAAQWVKEALRIFKTAPDNPFGDDNEAIAGYLLTKLEERDKAVSLKENP